MTDKKEFDDKVFVKVRSTGKLLDAKINFENDVANVELDLSEYGISPWHVFFIIRILWDIKY